MVPSEPTEDKVDVVARGYHMEPKLMSSGEEEVIESMLNVLLPNRSLLVLAPEPKKDVETK